MLCRQQTLYTSHVFSIIQFFFYYQAFQSSSSLIHIPLVASLFDSWDPCLSLHHFPPYLQEVSSVLVHPPNGLSLRLGYTRIPNLFPLYIRTSKLLFKMGLHSSTPAYYRYTFFRFCIPAIRNVSRISSSFSPFSPSLCSHLSLRSPRSLFLSFPFLSSSLNNYSALLPVLSLPPPWFHPSPTALHSMARIQTPLNKCCVKWGRGQLTIFLRPRICNGVQHPTGPSSNVYREICPRSFRGTGILIASPNII